MNIPDLITELTAGHPGTGAYNADAALAAGELNAVNRTLNKTSLSGTEILNNVVKADFNALTATEQQRVWDIVHLGDVNPFGIEAAMMIDIFGVGSATITALAAARTTSVSRATEIGLGYVWPGHVETARL